MYTEILIVVAVVAVAGLMAFAEPLVMIYGCDGAMLVIRNSNEVLKKKLVK